MSATKNKLDDTTGDREILISRVFDAPRELVWQAWTDPRHVVHWWGPRGFTTTIEEMDVRPGGEWKHVMRGPDGVNYPNYSVFTEVVKPERIVYSHGGHREGGPEISFVSTWTFDVVAPGKTRLTIRMVFPTADARNLVVKEFGALEGAKQTLARLAEHLAATAPSTTAENTARDFVISRTFAAPRELVWKAWTEPKHMAQWWGPHNFTNPVCEMDVRVGGQYRIVMRGPEGDEYPLEGTFRDIVPPERLVLFMDCSAHPEEWHNLVNPNRDRSNKPYLGCIQIVTFETEGDKTKLTIRTRLESAAIRDNMVKVGMNEGWSGSLDRLQALLAKLQ